MASPFGGKEMAVIPRFSGCVTMCVVFFLGFT
jgi:hypothetical protein